MPGPRDTATCRPRPGQGEVPRHHHARPEECTASVPAPSSYTERLRGVQRKGSAEQPNEVAPGYHRPTYEKLAYSVLYQGAPIMTHRDGLPRFSALSVRCGDAGHREACATPSESLGKPPLRSRMRPVGGRRKVLTMHRIACNFPPARRAAYAISMSHDRCPLVLRGGRCCEAWIAPILVATSGHRLTAREALSRRPGCPRRCPAARRSRTDA